MNRKEISVLAAQGIAIPLGDGTKRTSGKCSFGELSKREAEARLLDIADMCLEIIAQPVTEFNFQEHAIAVLTLDVITQRQSRFYALVQEWPGQQEPTQHTD